MNLRDLKYVIAVAEHQNFTRAAQAENVSQPTLSNQIKKLEAELGAAIFERGQSGVTLSAFGTQIINHARDIVGSANSIKAIAQDLVSTEEKTLRLGVTPTLAAYLSRYFRDVLAPALPKLRILIVEEYPQALAKMVESRTVDIALIARKSFDTITADQAHPLDFTSLWLEPLYLGVRKGHALTQNSSIWSHEVPKDQLVRFSISFGYDLEADLPVPTAEAIEKTGIDPNTSRFETVCRHVAQTDACTIINAIAAEQFKQDDFGLAFIPFSDAGNMRELGALTHSQFTRRNILNALRDGVHNAPPRGTISSKGDCAIPEHV